MLKSLRSLTGSWLKVQGPRGGGIRPEARQRYDNGAPQGAANRRERSRSPELIASYVAATVIALWLGVEAWELGTRRFYNIDEFRYAHAAWLVSRGQIPYLDFWDPKFPFLYQVLSLAFVGGHEDPLRVHWMRYGMLVFLAVTCWAGWQLTRRQLRGWAILTPLFMLSLWTLTFQALEIQPDGLATALYLASLAIPTLERLPRMMRGAVAGALLGLALWTSQKAFCYGVPVAVALALDVFHNRRRGSGYLLGHPIAFVAGFLAVVAAILSYLLSTASLWAWYDSCIDTVVFAHSDLFPDRSLWLTYRLLLRDGWALQLFALVGVGDALRRLWRKRSRALGRYDLLLLLSLLFTFLAWYLQKGPYLYSLVPFMATLCVFAARGLGVAWRQAMGLRPTDEQRRTWSVGGVSALLTLHFLGALGRAGMTNVPDNSHQHTVLSQVAALTGPDDPVYDNSGSYVARPHAFDPYFTNHLMRSKSMPEQLSREVPAAILRSSCTVFLRDARAAELPHSLRSWLSEHFRPVTPDIWLWGRRFRFSGDPEERQEFHAVRDSHYAVWPQGELEGVLKVDGVARDPGVLRLTPGTHEVRFVGAKAAQFDIVWVPRTAGVPPLVTAPSKMARQFSYIYYYEHTPIQFLP